MAPPSQHPRVWMAEARDRRVALVPDHRREAVSGAPVDRRAPAPRRCGQGPGIATVASPSPGPPVSTSTPPGQPPPSSLCTQPSSPRGLVPSAACRLLQWPSAGRRRGWSRRTLTPLRISQPAPAGDLGAPCSSRPTGASPWFYPHIHTPPHWATGPCPAHPAAHPRPAHAPGLPSSQA